MRLLRIVLGKELREILASRAYWLMLAMLGPLVGHAFLTSIALYSEAGDAHAAISQGLSPLDGILVPAFGVYDLAAMLFFPFVAIRLIATERENGVLRLLPLQSPASTGVMLSAKALALLAAWIWAWTPGFLATGLWVTYGGHISSMEFANLLLGYLLRGALTIGVAMAAAGIARSAASAAIATLGFTVGTWALDFLGAWRGGIMQTLAAFTPGSALRSFETGLLSPARAMVLAGVAITGVVLAGIWTSLDRGMTRRMILTAALAATLAAFFAAALWIPPSTEIDVSEDRRHSLPAADTAALRKIHQPLRVTVRLGPEDPRLTDLQHNVLAKLARVLPSVAVEYPLTGHTGLADTAHYGEVWYEMNGRREMTRSATEAIVLETIYKLAGVAPPAAGRESVYPGYPLQAQPRGAFWLLVVIWPVGIGVLCWLRLRK